MIVLKNIGKKYGDQVVFEDLNLEIEKNKFTALVGPSGIGKTSLLRILMGLDKDYTGEIINYNPRNISVVFQENRLLENFSILENINLVLRKKLDQDTLKTQLKLLGLEPSPNEKVKNLSGGMKRRIAILRALALDKEYYIFDEPFKDMDRETQLRLLKLVEEKLRGKTLIFTSHSQLDIDYLNPRIIDLGDLK